MLKITLKSGDSMEVAQGTTVDALCREISMGLYRNACAARVDGQVVDLRTELDKDALRADGLLEKYTRPKTSYRITVAANKDE